MNAGFLLRAAFLLVLPLLVPLAHAGEIKVLSGMGMRAILTELKGEFERSTGHTLNISYGTAGLVKDRIRGGEMADVAIMQRYLLDELLQQGSITRGTTMDVARSPIGLAARAGARIPDIGSVEALRRALLEAESISYTDPAAGGLSGSHFARVLEQLGIGEQMKPRTRLGSPMSRVVNGEVEFAILQVSEILALPGVQFIGRLPAPLQDDTPVSAAIIHRAHRADAGMEFVRFLRSAAAASVMRAYGMEPVER